MASEKMDRVGGLNFMLFSFLCLNFYVLGSGKSDICSNLFTFLVMHLVKLAIFCENIREESN